MGSYEMLFKNLNKYFKSNIKLSYVLETRIFIVTEDDDFYEFDRRNSFLALSNESLLDSFFEESLLEELCNKNVIDIKHYYHTIARTIDGKVYCWGHNYKGVLGNGREEWNTTTDKPELNEFLKDKHVIDICCGFQHSLVLTIDGEVYVWGDNEFGQIGCADNRECQLIPYLVQGFNGEKVEAIACGSYHSLALTESGHVFSWGLNDCGQLGYSSMTYPSNSPKIIDENVLFVRISCGRKHSLMLSVEGTVYVLGANDLGQLGTNDYKNQYFPKRLIHSNKFKDIASHSHYDISAAISSDGLIFVWGECGKEIINEPKVVEHKSFDEVFENYFQINYKMKNRSIVKFNDDFIRNGLFEMKFEEIEKLGEGGYGQVFKVRERYSLRREARFAIKKMEFKEDIVLEFLKELKTSAIICEFNNQNLIRYSDVWLEKIKLNFVLFIQMEICDKPLTHIIDEIDRTPELKTNDFLTPLGYYIACEIFIEILEGVEYLHENNTIHRDLKPDNILLGISKNKKFVKIADFGLLAFHKYAIEVKNQNKDHKYAKYSHTTDVGDMDYAAPEVLDGRIYDTRADLYSLGVVLQKLFCIPEDGYKK
jgi:hypothetical protein